MKTGIRLAYLIVLCVVSGCAAPRGAALQTDIIKESQSEDANFTVIPVTRAALPQIERWPATGQGLSLNWPGKGQSQTSRALRNGDTVNLMIWDSQDQSLIAPAEQRSVPVRGLTLSPGGTIFVPYVGEVKLAGMTPEDARSEIQSRLTPIAPSAQVQLEVQQGDRNMIELVSGVQKPGRYPMGANGLTILSVLAEAGGIPDSMRNPVVRLQRGGKSYAALSADLYRDPAQDIMMRGGDRVAVVSDSRSFVVLGAAGAEKTVQFQKASHTLLEGLSLSSGLQEARANIRAVLVLRKYPARALRKDGTGPATEDMVFSFDLASGDGLFAARSFKINPDDVILATESPLPSTSAVMSVFGSFLGLANRVTNN